MKARRVVASVVTAGAMLVAGAVSASANISWCIDDPPVQVETPAGTNLTVNTGVSVVSKQARYLNDVAVVAVTEPDGNGGTLITVTVTVPATIGTANVTATVNKFKVSASTTVAGGDSATLVLDVPAA
jgi:hypothetical protein